ncbi:MAG: RIP metalloprotease RseP [Blautia sp.]|nr:RIP metalloprotease RseP [Blautia sp.]
MSIILAVLIFSAIILFHEFGHYLLARRNGIKVVEFSLGMGPRVFSVVKGETRYSVKCFPLGGSCMMLDELGEDSGEKGSFASASVWSKIAVVAAGPVFNFILAFLLSLIIVGAAGYDEPIVTDVPEDSAVYEAGLQAGDRIIRYDGYAIDVSRDLYIYLYLNPPKVDQQINMTVLRDGEKVKISYMPDVSYRYLLGFNRTGTDSMTVESLIPGLPLEDAGVLPGDRIVAVGGVRIEDGYAYDEYLKDHPLTDEPLEIIYERNGLEYETEIIPKQYRQVSRGFSYSMAYQKAAALSVVPHALIEVKYMIRSTLLSLKELVRGKVGVEELSGPIGVVSAIDDTYQESKSLGIVAIIINLLNMAVLLSANLGVMNLLPIPALDGGRLVLLIVEAIRRKPLNQEIEGRIHFAGFILLMILMVFVMFNDVIKLI